MPELPEVETVKETLKRYVLNQRIEKVIVRYPKMIENCDVGTFITQLSFQTILDVQRKGKFLIFICDRGYIISHLRMEGKYYYNSHTEDKHTHLIFVFHDHTTLAYHDVRKFGKFYYFDQTQKIEQLAPLNRLGKEPFELLDGSYLYQKIHLLKKPIKMLLLDQSILAGIGNIYADEICFASKISPFKSANQMTKKECNRMIEQAKKILTEAIQLGGSTVRSYQSEHGINGKFQTKLHVYGREGLPCDICQTNIIKTKLNQRGTHYCPHCQKGKKYVNRNNRSYR